MKDKLWIDRETPLSVYFGYLTKQYVGAISNSLSHIALDRYFVVLSIIDQYGETFTQQHLANYFKIDKASVVRIVNYLVEKGYIRRQVNEQDRREYFIVLTEMGKQIVPEIKASIAQLNQEALKGLSAKQIDQLFFSLDKIGQNLATLSADEFVLSINRVAQSGMPG